MADMRTIKFNLDEDKDILVKVPERLETKRSELLALAGIEMQAQIADGNVRVIKRVWPCLYCDTTYLEQGELIRHLETHEELEKRLKKKLAHLYEKPQENALPEQAPIPTVIAQPEARLKREIVYEKTDGYKVRQLRSSLSESQAQFAKRFHVAQSIISQWETNRTKPPQEVLAWRPQVPALQTTH